MLFGGQRRADVARLRSLRERFGNLPLQVPDRRAVDLGRRRKNRIAPPDDIVGGRACLNLGFGYRRVRTGRRPGACCAELGCGLRGLALENGGARRAAEAHVRPEDEGPLPDRKLFRIQNHGIGNGLRRRPGIGMLATHGPVFAAAHRRLQAFFGPDAHAFDGYATRLGNRYGAGATDPANCRRFETVARDLAASPGPAALGRVVFAMVAQPKIAGPACPAR